MGHLSETDAVKPVTSHLSFDDHHVLPSFGIKGPADASFHKGGGWETGEAALPSGPALVSLRQDRSRQHVPVWVHKKLPGQGYIGPPQKLGAHAGAGHAEAGHTGERRHTEAGHAEHGHSEHGHGVHGHAEALVCETRHGHEAHHIAHSCHIASIVILCIFLVEIILKFWVDPKGFIHNKFLMLDAFIVIVSLLADTVIMWWVEENRPERKQDVQMFAIVLLFLRIWRVVRIAHGLAEHMHHYHEAEEHVEELKQNQKIMKKDLQKAEGDIQYYKNLLASRGIDTSALTRDMQQVERDAAVGRMEAARVSADFNQADRPDDPRNRS